MTYRLTIEDYDRMPRAARQALAESLVIGNGDHRLFMKRDKAAVMADRIRRADAILVKDNNTIMPGGNLRAVNAVLNGWE
jgi:hypothetical protein